MAHDTIRAMGDAFTVVFGGLLAFFVITILLLGVFSRRSPREILDWKPAGSREADAENEREDIAQMLAAQNELKRRRGAPELTQAEVEARVREDQRWRGS
jgi:hypothetical protein